MDSYDKNKKLKIYDTSNTSIELFKEKEYWKNKFIEQQYTYFKLVNNLQQKIYELQKKLDNEVIDLS